MVLNTLVDIVHSINNGRHHQGKTVGVCMCIPDLFGKIRYTKETRGQELDRTVDDGTAGEPSGGIPGRGRPNDRRDELVAGDLPRRDTRRHRDLESHTVLRLRRRPSFLLEWTPTVDPIRHLGSINRFVVRSTPALP